MPAIPERALDAYLNARYFHAFQNQKNERVVLQWQLLPHCAQEDRDATFRQRAQEIKMDGIPVLALNPTDQLLHTCVLCSTGSGVTRWRRMSDALLLLDRAAPEINWEQLLERLETEHVVLPARDILTPLAEQFGAPIPVPVQEKIKTLRVSSDEQREASLWDAATPRERIAQLWYLAARRSCRAGAISRALRFPTFLQHWWGLEHLTQLPPRAAAAFHWQRLRRG